VTSVVRWFAMWGTVDAIQMLPVEEPQ